MTAIAASPQLVCPLSAPPAYRRSAGTSVVLLAAAISVMAADPTSVTVTSVAALGFGLDATAPDRLVDEYILAQCSRVGRSTTGSVDGGDALSFHCEIDWATEHHDAAIVAAWAARLRASAGRFVLVN